MGRYRWLRQRAINLETGMNLHELLNKVVMLRLYEPRLS